MPDFIQAHVGGSFAPPLSDEALVRYLDLAEELPPSPVKDGMLTLFKCCDKWWNLPEPNGTAQTPHPVAGTIVALQADHAKALWELIPWDHELDGIALVFETIDAGEQKELRDAAFHLLWHVKELNLDREPLTADKVLPTWRMPGKKE